MQARIKVWSVITAANVCTLGGDSNKFAEEARGTASNDLISRAAALGEICHQSYFGLVGIHGDGRVRQGQRSPRITQNI